jgi:hypothetical protein
MWEVMEPVHWFDPGIAIDPEEAVLISVIDEVYPELRLADRIRTYRHEMGRTGQVMVGPQPQPPAEVLAELAAVLRRYGY